MRPPDGFAPDPWREPEEAADPLASGSDDPPPPVSTIRRRLATLVALVFIVVIVAFLAWFVATHWERAEGGTFFGSSDGASRAVPLRNRVGRTIASCGEIPGGLKSESAERFSAAANPCAASGGWNRGEGAHEVRRHDRPEVLSGRPRA